MAPRGYARVYNTKSAEMLVEARAGGADVREEAVSETGGIGVEFDNTSGGKIDAKLTLAIHP